MSIDRGPDKKVESSPAQPDGSSHYDPTTSRSLLHATLESTTEGILALDRDGKIVCFNSKVARIWQMPQDALKNSTGQELIEFCARQVKDSVAFIKRIDECQATAETESFDVIELKSGRIIERIIRPQWDDCQCIGTVWSFRDVTEQKRSDEALRESRALFYSFVEQLPSGVFRKDIEGRYVFVNSSFCQILKLSADQILGKLPRELVGVLRTAEDPAKLGNQGEDHHKRVMASGRPIEVEDHYSDANGRIHSYHTIKLPVMSSDGRIIGTQGILTDITERKQAEKALQESQALYQSLVNELPAGVFRKNKQGRYVFVNSWFCRLKGVNADRFLGKMPTELAATEVAGQPERQGEINRLAQQGSSDHEKILATGKTIHSEETYPAIDEMGERCLHVVKSPVFGSDGQIVGTQGILLDMTERKLAEQELEKVHKQLVDASRQAGMAEVATSVLHNVGNVLNSINVSTTLMAETLKKSRISSLSRLSGIIQEQQSNLAAFITTDPRGRRLPEYLSNLAEHLIREQQNLMKEMNETRKHIDHVKEIVKMQQNYAKVGGVAEKIKAVDLVEDALRLNANALARHGIAVIRDYSQGELPEINIEKHKALQILVNLIANAKYACDDAERKDKFVKLEIRNGSNHVRISVIDNGIGIPAENLIRIFNHGFTTRKSGHGFGLHSGALAAREMGGSLIAQSEGPGKGACFVLELPLHPPKSKA
jgi:PAS domain S-box-containing protein